MANQRQQGSAAKLILGLGALLVACVGTALVMVLGVDPGESVFTPPDDEPAVRGEEAGETAPGPSEESRPGERVAHGNASAKVAATLRGVVRLYRTREPVVGLALTLAVPEGDPLEAITGADGAFRFTSLEPVAGYELAGAREPYAAIDMTGIDLAPKEERDLGTLWLEVAVDLGVTVRDLTGSPVSGAEVTVFATGRSTSNDNVQPWSPEGQMRRVLALTSSPRPTKSATTDAGGAAVVAGLLPGHYHVRASAAGHAAASRSGVLLAPDAAQRAVELLLAPGHALSGAVTDEEGEPVAAAQVIAAPVMSKKPGLDRAAADADGSGAYSIDGLAAGTYTLYLAREDAPLLQVGNVGIPSTTRFDIRLRPTASIVGNVTGPDGEPVVDADVRCAAQGGLPLAARTDEEGHFEIPSVPAGQLQWFRITAEGFVPHPDPSSPQKGAGESLREGAEMRRDVRLERGLTVVATVRADDDNSPIEGARVQLMLAQMWTSNAAPWSAIADEEGKATISGLVPGEYLAVVEAPDFVQEGLPRNYRSLLNNPQAMPAKWHVSVEQGVGEKSVELRLTRGGIVTGRVLGPNDETVAGARVDVTGSRGELPIFTDADGRFRAEAIAPSRRATATATAPDLPKGTSEPFIVEAGETVADIEVKLAAAGRVTGVVRTSDGNPLRGAIVRYVAGELNERRVWSFNQFNNAKVHPVGADGRFEIAAVTAGKVTVRADAEGYLPAWDAGVEVIADQETGGVDLILSPATELSGRVEGPGGSPVAGATVSANYLGTAERRVSGFVPGLAGQPSTQSDAEGRFTLRGLKRGKYHLWAAAQEHKSKGTQTETGAGEVLLTLAEGLSISGVVKDSSGAALGGVPVRATKTNNSSGRNHGWWGGNQVYTAPDGTFEIRSLEEGAYDLTVSAQWIWGREVNVQDTTLRGVTTGREDAEVIVEAGQTIEGALLDADDEPVNVGWISARFEAGSGGSRGATQRWNRVLPNGKFRIVGLQPGTYTLQPYGSFQSDAMKGVAAGTTDVELRVRQGFVIQGFVTDEEGLSLPGGMSIQARRVGEDKFNGRNVVTPGDGSFTIMGLEEGAYDLRVAARGFAPQVVSKVSTGTSDFLVVLAQGVTITGIVVDVNGLPVSSASVQGRQLAVAEGSVAAAANTRTNESGTFELTGLIDGEYRLVVRARNLAPAFLSPVGGGTADMRVVLETGASVSGTVKDAGGQPLPNVRMQLMSPEGESVSYCRSEPDGRFEFKNVPSEGSWKLTGRAWVNGQNMAVSREEPVESGAKDVDVKAE